MKLPLDANISWRLICMLNADFPEIIHVDQLGLGIPASDFQIWNYALNNNFTIVTNDEDFNLLLQSHGFTPKVILLKTGNQSTRFMAALLSNSKGDIISFLNSNEY